MKKRLLPFMEMDSHAKNGQYTIRSLYFDDYWNSAYEEKIMGVEDRRSGESGFTITAMPVSNWRGRRKTAITSIKIPAPLSREEYDRILAGDYEFLLSSRFPLCQEFYYECMVKLQRPKVIVDYERTPLIRAEGDVRITFDQDVRGGVFHYDIFDPNLPE